MKNKNNQDQESPYYSRETLYREVWEKPMIHVAKRYGVSNGALAKTCRKLHVPKPGPGYWAKKAHGYEPDKPPLPDFSESPDELTIMHPFVRNTDRKLRSRLNYRGSRSQYLRVGSSGTDTFNVCVSPDNIDRTLRILQTLWDAFSIRDITVLTGKETSYSTPAPTLRIMGVYLKFRTFELSKRTVKPDSESRSRPREYDYSATGILQFEIEAPSYSKEYRTQ